MNTIFCDRCGSRIDGKPLGMHFAYGNDLSLDMRRIEKMDFCEECMAEILDFALHKNVCDECVQQMKEENVMLREAAEETGPSTKIEPDSDEIDWNAALNRMEQCRFSAKVLIPAEKIQEVEKIIREECLYESGKYIIPVQPVDPDLISKYRKAIEKYGVPKQCVNIPVTSSSDE